MLFDTGKDLWIGYPEDLVDPPVIGAHLRVETPTPPETCALIREKISPLLPE